jgi:hypothetical protein
MPHAYPHAQAAGLALLVLLSAAAAPARAQAPNDRGAPAPAPPDNLASVLRTGSGPLTPVTVLMAPSVQAELKLSDAQKSKLFNLSVAATQKQRDHVQAMLLGGRTAGGDPRAMMAARDALRQQNEQSIQGILEPKQRERFDQIVLRFEGPLAVARPEIASKINLNSTQKQYVQTVMIQLQQSQRMLFLRLRQAAAAGQVGPDQIGQLHAMAEKLRDEAVGQLGKILDRKQKNAFNKLLGAPFDVSRLDDPASAGDAPASSTEKEKEKEKDGQDNEKPAGKPARRKSRGRTKSKS